MDNMDTTESEERKDKLLQSREEYKTLISNTPIIFCPCKYDQEWIMLLMSELKKSQQELKKTRDMYENVVNTQQEMICRFKPDTTLIFANPAYCDSLGLSKEELLGKRFIELLSPAEQELVSKCLKEAIAKGEAVTYEHQLESDSGELIYTRWTDCPIYDERGELIEFQSIGFDITELKNEQKELKKRKNQLDSILNNTKDVIWSLSWPELNINFVSSSVESLYGYSPEEFKENPEIWQEIIVPEDSHLFQKALEELREKGEAERVYRIISKEGSIKWAHDKVKLIYDKKGEAIRLDAITSDITALKQVENQLKKEKRRAEQANKAKSEFLANMSHEIRTPLNAVIGFSEILESKLEVPQYQGYLKSIKNAGNNLLKLINNILDISKIEAGHFELEKDWLDPCAIIEEMESIFAYRAQEKGVSFIRECVLIEDLGYKGGLLEIRLDERRLRQILINLIGNAIKFTATGYIRVSAQIRAREESYLTVEFIIEDTGIGIKLAEQERVFKAFTQQEGQSFEYEGTGLGLNICQRLVEQMGGEIELDSEVDQGSTFKVVLPQLEYRLSELPIEADNVNYTCLRFNSQRVLAVDDDDTNLEVLEIILKERGLEVLTVNSGEQAIKLLQEDEVELILLDLKMSPLNGYQTKKLIEEELSLEIPIIALTAFATTEEESRVRNSGFSSFLTKPIKEEILVAELSNYLEYTTEEKLKRVAVKEEMSVPEGADLEVLIRILEEQFLDKTKELKEVMIINEVEELAEGLYNLAQDYGLNALSTYAQEILIDVEDFDLTGLEKGLAEFSNFLERLRERQNG